MVKNVNIINCGFYVLSYFENGELKECFNNISKKGVEDFLYPRLCPECAELLYVFLATPLAKTLNMDF